MASEIVRVDSKGRLLIPKHVREKVGIEPGSLVKITVKDGVLIVEPLPSIATKYFGVFKVKKWPQDIDEFTEKVLRRWLLSENT